MGLITAKQIARALGISLGTLYRMVRTGKLPAIRIGTGRGLRFDLDEVKSALAKEPFRSQPRPLIADEPLLTIHQLAVDSGIKDLAQHHDHYLYGLPPK